MTDKKGVVISKTATKGDQVGGSLSMSEDVVATIAHNAARGAKGIHSMGKAGLLNRSVGPDVTRGVSAEVGEAQAALDLAVVIEYGFNIEEVCADVRRRIYDAVFKMAGREVVEVNISVTGIHMEE